MALITHRLTHKKTVDLSDQSCGYRHSSKDKAAKAKAAKHYILGARTARKLVRAADMEKVATISFGIGSEIPTINPGIPLG